MVIKMNYENYLCIYENDGQCILDEIELDVGLCKECIYVDISNNDLEQKKQKIRDRIS